MADTALSNDGLAEIVTIPSILILDISFTKVDDRGLNALQQLRKLRELDVSALHLKDPRAVVSSLCRLKQLRVLTMHQNFAGSDLPKLRQLKNLTSLDIAGNRITDSDLPALLNLPNLTTLKIFSTPITNAGLDTIAKLKSLQNLDLGDTAITDDGLKKLERLRGLEELTIRHCRITDQAISHFNAAVTGCQIHNTSDPSIDQSKNTGNVWSRDRL